MSKTSIKMLHISLICMLFNLSVFSQNRQGNIVEYFGKEKVEEINEGDLVHVFSEGLVLGQSRYVFGSNATTPKDAIVGNHLLNPGFIIAEGKVGHTDATGNEFKWEVLKINDKSEFSDRRLRSGYLYLEYQSDSPQTVLFEASGHTKLIANGKPHEGDHYDFGYSLIPMQLKKGKNTFLLTGGRFPRMRARLIKPKADVQLTTRDMTLPDILQEEKEVLLGGIRILNADQKWFRNGSVSVTIDGNTVSTPVPAVSPLNSRKIVVNIPSVSSDAKSADMQVQLRDKSQKLLSEYTVKINVKSNKKHHKRTFVSQIDRSVQYYSVAPCTIDTLSKPALFLSVHGASVEAVNQARAYQQKDWGHLVAPTNRRPFGFAWEDWGRMDALEVLAEVENRFNTDKQRTYLTGHSMGGHGTWYLGATYPDKWAAIAPAAGYPDLLGYRGSFVSRLKNIPDEQLARFGMTREQANKMLQGIQFDNQQDMEMDSIIRRAGNPSRTLKLKRNYLHFGVYVLHGEDDSVVPTFIARDMRALLGSYHPDFTYYEYPRGTHWYGDHSVDWPPIFDYFKFRTIKPSSDIDRLEFYTGSPGVSASSHFITINQQQDMFGISSFKFKRDDKVTVATENASALTIDLDKMANDKDSIEIDGQVFGVVGKARLVLKKDAAEWGEVADIPLSEKGPHRNGGFKDAFRNNFVLVYASHGSKDENAWYYARARADAELFYYRANGNVEIVRDRDFIPGDYKDRNVIIYGNADNNRAWKKLLSDCPLQVKKGELTFGGKTLSGDNYGAYYIYPKHDSDIASIGVVTATGKSGMKAAYANHYLLNATTFPDVLIFNETVLLEGLPGVTCSGFFGNDWSYEKGEFVWRK
jgi:pimeloyl-ACP methyl ester carboxylesterase